MSGSAPGPGEGGSGATVILGDCLEVMRGLPSGSAQTCVTSPPYYGLRSYLPNGVRIRGDLSSEQRSWLESELLRRGIYPTSGEV